MTPIIRFIPTVNGTSIRMPDVGIELTILWPFLCDEEVEVREYRKLSGSSTKSVTGYMATRVGSGPVYSALYGVRQG